MSWNVITQYAILIHIRCGQFTCILLQYQKLCIEFKSYFSALVCRSKNDDLESVSYSLKQELQTQATEENNLKEYKQELEHLLAEKLHHVEQLRQIHSDINMVRSRLFLGIIFAVTQILISLLHILWGQYGVDGILILLRLIKPSKCNILGIIMAL